MCFFVCLCCEHVQCISLFVCVVSMCSVFICLCCEHVQCFSLFVCVESMCSAFLYLFVL